MFLSGRDSIFKGETVRDFGMTKGREMDLAESPDSLHAGTATKPQGVHNTLQN